LAIGKYTDIFGGYFPSGELVGWVYLGGFFHAGNFRGGRKFSIKGVLDIPALLKYDLKLNDKKVFSTESKEQH